MEKIYKELEGDNRLGYTVAILMFSVVTAGLLSYVVRDPLGVAMLIYPTGFVLTSVLSVQPVKTTFKMALIASAIHLLTLILI